MKKSVLHIILPFLLFFAASGFVLENLQNNEDQVLVLEDLVDSEIEFEEDFAFDLDSPDFGNLHLPISSTVSVGLKGEKPYNAFNTISKKCKPKLYLLFKHLKLHC